MTKEQYSYMAALRGIANAMEGEATTLNYLSINVQGEDNKDVKQAIFTASYAVRSLSENMTELLDMIAKADPEQPQQ